MWLRLPLLITCTLLVFDQINCSTLKNQKSGDILTTAQQQINYYQQIISNQNKLIDDLIKKNTELQGCHRSTTSVFMVYLSNNEDVPVGHIIKWDGVKINYGGNYNVKNGTYTAPVNGIYEFTVQKEIIEIEPGLSAHFSILVDGVDSAISTDEDDGDLHPTRTSTVLLQLSAGQGIQVRNLRSSKLKGGSVPHSWFQGKLITETN